jgi:hypothetical protein
MATRAQIWQLVRNSSYVPVWFVREIASLIVSSALGDQSISVAGKLFSDSPVRSGTSDGETAERNATKHIPDSAKVRLPDDTLAADSAVPLREDRSMIAVVAERRSTVPVPLQSRGPPTRPPSLGADIPPGMGEYFSPDPHELNSTVPIRSEPLFAIAYESRLLGDRNDSALRGFDGPNDGVYCQAGPFRRIFHCDLYPSRYQPGKTHSPPQYEFQSGPCQGYGIPPRTHMRTLFSGDPLDGGV